MRRNAFAVGWALGLVALVLGPVWGATVALPYADDFETVAVGVYPFMTGWTRAATGQTAAVSNLAASSGTKSFRLGSLPWSTRTDYVLLSDSPDLVAYEAALCLDGLYGRAARVGFVVGTGGPTQMWNYFRADVWTGRLGFQGISWVDLGAYTPGTWVLVGADLDYQDEVANLWVNEVQVADDVPITPKTFTDPSLGTVTLNRLGLNAPSNNSGEKHQGNIVYFDTVSIWEWTKTIPVSVDIKPDSYPNLINPKSRGVVPVAILSDEAFDATQVDPSTVRVAGAAVAVRGKGKYLAHACTVNGDALVDLLVQIETEQLDAVELTSGDATVTGALYDGREFAGQDEVVVVPSE